MIRTNKTTLKFALISLSLFIFVFSCKSFSPFTDSHPKVVESENDVQSSLSINKDFIIKRKDIPKLSNEDLSICSFNIKFLGHSKQRKDKYIADLLKEACDVIAIQELTAPPLITYNLKSSKKISKTFPDGSPIELDQESGKFFDIMIENGFDFILSTEDTGWHGNHTNSSSSEWFVLFYNRKKVSPVKSSPLTGFIDNPLSANKDFARVPYAFHIKTTNSKLDFVIISTHLHYKYSKKIVEDINNNPEKNKDILNKGKSWRIRNTWKRKHEINIIYSWVKEKLTNKKINEKDFIILGDMNVSDLDEMNEVIPPELHVLNSSCIPTNANYQKSPKCFDQVLLNQNASNKLRRNFNLKVLNLQEFIKADFNNSYNQDEFSYKFSDHFPVLFRLKIPKIDND